MSDRLRVPLWSGLSDRVAGWRNRKIASFEFQKWASGNPLTRRIARGDADRLYDLVAGFVYSQTLLACVELRLFHLLKDRAESAQSLAVSTGLAPDRMLTLCKAAAALGLLKRGRKDRFRLGRLGAAVLGVPGLEDMIRHHRLFYNDLADPVALLKDRTEPSLAGFWPYVGGKTDDIPDDVAVTYSDLMASSQLLVAEETLRHVRLDDTKHLMDLGGGSGAFLGQVSASYPDMALTLVDLPPVVETAHGHFRNLGLETRIECVGLSFLDTEIPRGADAVSLVRVLYDHDDPVVQALLRKVFEALPPGGRLLISEPMSGGMKPTKAGDAYFGFYTMAMTTGKPRSAAEHSVFLKAAGFVDIKKTRTSRPFVTSLITARKPEPRGT